MRTINVRNVNHALDSGLHYLKVAGVITGSRNGPVLVAPGPVITAYQKPTERVLFSPLRDCNPFFHLFESVWMLAGRNDSAPLETIVPRMGTFSDDDVTLNGAYGFRWREYFGFDQIVEATTMLRKDPSTRRCVLAMWNAAGYVPGTVGYVPGTAESHYTPDLLNQTSKDLPCNTHIYFDATRGPLDMTVCNRSNDVIWGAYGANAVHMSFLHEYVALVAGLDVGTYYQMSNNYHIYTARPDTQRLISTAATDRRHWHVQYQPVDYYETASAVARPLLSYEEAKAGAYFLRECEDFVQCVADGLDHTKIHWVYDFTKHVVAPIMTAHARHKAGDTAGALAHLEQCMPSDWRTSGIIWLNKRLVNRKETGHVVV